VSKQKLNERGCYGRGAFHSWASQDDVASSTSDFDEHRLKQRLEVRRACGPRHRHMQNRTKTIERPRSGGIGGSGGHPSRRFHPWQRALPESAIRPPTLRNCQRYAPARSRIDRTP
jgi:hypothetical protein